MSRELNGRQGRVFVKILQLLCVHMPLCGQDNDQVTDKQRPLVLKKQVLSIVLRLPELPPLSQIIQKALTIRVVTHLPKNIFIKTMNYLFGQLNNNSAVFCIATYATHVNNDVSKHILFDQLNNNLAVFCIATYAIHVNNYVSKLSLYF